MARPLRLQFSNACYHLTARGNRKERIFFTDQDRRVFISKLNETLEKFCFTCFAYCLMVNHYHLFLRTLQPNLSAGIHFLNSSFANWIKKKRKITGPVFQGRFKSILVEEENYALNLSSYIHLNPCRWKIVEHPEEYPWSSCRDYLGLRAPLVENLDFSFILRAFDSVPDKARVLYRNFLKERARMENPLDDSFEGIALGSPAFISKIQDFVRTQGFSPEHPALPIKRASAVFAEEVILAIQEVCCIEREDILARRWSSPFRLMGLFLVKRHCGMDLKSIGRLWGISYSAVSKNAERFEKKLGENETLRALTEKIEIKIRGYRARRSMSPERNLRDLR